MKFTVLIPVADNNHKPFSKSKLTSITTRLAFQFGGCTMERNIEGIWFDGPTVYRDRHLRVTVVCDKTRRAEARQAVIEIGKELGQLSMFWEVVEKDGVEIIPIQ